jgi:hypothetical protein
MSTYEKDFVRSYESIEKFAQAVGALKIYESESNFHAVRRPGDEEAILASPYVKDPKLVWER